MSGKAARDTKRRSTDVLFDRYYFGRPEFVNGTVEFHALCGTYIRQGASILEIGAGPPNPTTRYLASVGRVVGLDVSEEVTSNAELTEGVVYDGDSFPFPEGTFDACVANFVLEHVASPARHFAEVARVLRPGGVYVVRTPNLWHYVAIGSRLLPHGVHVILSKSLRGQTAGDHDPWVTYYRANTARALRRLAGGAGLEIVSLQMVEKEPSYGRSSKALFYPMMLYERSVNAIELLAGVRCNLFAVFRSPGG